MQELDVPVDRKLEGQLRDHARAIGITPEQLAARLVTQQCRALPRKQRVALVRQEKTPVA